MIDVLHQNPEKQVMRDKEVGEMGLRFEQIKKVAKELLSDTSLMDENKKPSTDDIEKFKKFFVKTAPFFHQDVFPSFPSHSLAVALGLEAIAEKCNFSTPPQAVLDGLIHDFPSIMTPRNYLRKNIISKPFMQRLGITSEFYNKPDPVPRILGIGSHSINTIDDMSEEERIFDLIDNVMKTDANDNIRPWEDFETVTLDPAKQKAIYGTHHYLWPSTTFGMNAMYQGGKNNLAGRLVLDEKEWLEQKYGIKIQDVLKETQLRLDLPVNKEWLLQVRNAQESLDPEIDKELRKPKIETVVFDIGGVFLTGSDEMLLTSIAEKTGANIENLKTAFNKFILEGMKGESPDFYQKFSEVAGTKITGKEFALRNFLQPNIEMEAILKDLEKSGVNYLFWTNSFLSRSSIVVDDMFNYFGINKGKIIISSEHNLSKYDHSAFLRFANYVDTDISKLILVDDSTIYTTNARSSGMRGLTFRGNSYKNILPIQRLRQEFILAGLIKE